MLSLNNRAVSTIADAKATPSLMSLARADRDGLEGAILDLLTEADELLGSGMAPGTLATMARMIVDDFGGRSSGDLLLAVRNGVKSKTIGHKLTYPILCEWINEQDARVEQYHHNEYLSHK